MEFTDYIFPFFFSLYALRLTNLYLLIYRKQCVQKFNVFDFLREIVSKVPDLGGSDTAGEERSVAKRRFESVILVSVHKKY